MKKITAARGEIIFVDDDQYERLITRSWHLTTRGYACASINGKSVFMHRIINNTPEGFLTDHINRNKLDNQKLNLRTVTRFQSEVNKTKLNTNKSGVPGVHKTKHGWRSTITINGKTRHLCYSSKLQDAKEVYDAFKSITNYAKFHCVKGCCCD